MSKFGVLIISLVAFILPNRPVNCYDDLEKNCQSGEKIGSFKRDSTDNENGRLSFECQQLHPSSEAVKVYDGCGDNRKKTQEPKCEQVKPFICNGQVTGCPQGTWLAGVTSYQLDTSGTPDL
uniref:Uncharacterized protein n=1 Tax=Romanomermis culicivorax TaxID=13658 RepID=A0A915KCJ5_ROMCU